MALCSVAFPKLVMNKLDLCSFNLCMAVIWSKGKPETSLPCCIVYKNYFELHLCFRVPQCLPQ